MPRGEWYYVWKSKGPERDEPFLILTDLPGPPRPSPASPALTIILMPLYKIELCSTIFLDITKFFLRPILAYIALNSPLKDITPPPVLEIAGILQVLSS